MRVSPTAELSAFATCMSVIVLALALLPISYVMRVQWFGPRAFVGNFGMPFDYRNPQPPYGSYRLLIRAFSPAVSKNFKGDPWLPTAVPERFRSVHDFSANVFAGEDRIEIQVVAVVPSLPNEIVNEYQWNRGLGDVPIFRFAQQAMDRATAVGEILTMRAQPDEPVLPATEALGLIRLDGRIAVDSYQPIADTEDIGWQEGSWTVRVTGRDTQIGDVDRLALEVARALDRLSLPKGIGVARFSVDSPTDEGQLIWATHDGLMSAGSQIEPLVAIDVARSMTPMVARR